MSLASEIQPYLRLEIQPVLTDLGITRPTPDAVDIPGLGRCRVLPQSLVCLNQQQAIRSIGALELFVWMWRARHKEPYPQIYRRAVAWARRGLGLDDQPGQVERLARGLEVHRQLLNLMSIDPEDPNLELLRLRQVLVGRRVVDRLDRHTLRGLCGSDVQKLGRLLEQLEVGVRLPVGPCWVSPYYGQPHILSTLHLRTDLDHPPREVPIHPYELAYTGLSGVSDRQLVIGQSVLQTAVHGSQSAAGGRPAFYTHALYTAGADRGWIPPTPPTLLYDQDLTDLAILSRVLRGQGVGCSVWRAVDHLTGLGHPGELEGRLLEQIHQLVQDNHLNPEVIRLLEAQGPDTQFKARVESWLLETGRGGAAEQLNQRFGFGQLCQDSRTEVLITGQGYVWHDLQTGERLQLTNFTCAPRQLVSFPEVVSRSVELEVQAGGQTGRVLLPETALESGRKLQDWLLKAPAGQDLPLLRVLTVEKMSGLLREIRRGLPQLELCRGLSYVGFNPLRTSFYHPDFQVHGEALTDQPVPWNQGVQELQYFGQNLTTQTSLCELPPDLADLVALLLGLIQRWHRGWALRPIWVVNNEPNRRVVQQVFRGLGQSQAMSVGQNSRNREIRGVRGLPVWCVGLKERQAEDMQNPLVVLGERGMRFEQHEQHQLEQAAGCLRQLLRLMIPRLTTGGSWSEKPARRVLYEAAVAEEGAEIARQAGRLVSWPCTAQPYQNLELMLRSVEEKHVQEVFQWDMHGQRLLINLQLLAPSVRRLKDDLLVELQVQAGPARMEGGRLVCGELAREFVLNYYGQAPGCWSEEVDDVQPAQGC